jgi:hypothetical protein
MGLGLSAETLASVGLSLDPPNKFHDQDLDLWMVIFLGVRVFYCFWVDESRRSRFGGLSGW